MYIIKNAFKSITRNKARNILIGIVALVIAISACVALSIRQAAVTAKEDTLANMNITAQISYDRTGAMQEMRNEMGSDNSTTGSGGGKMNFDFSALQVNSLSLDDYMTYTEALSDEDYYYYTNSASLNVTGDLVAYGAEDNDTSSSGNIASLTDEAAPSDMEMQGGHGGMMGGGFSFMTQGDFTLTGYSSYDAMLSLFGEDGSCTISDGQMFAESSSDATCVISDELAILNSLSVGDTITLANPNYEDETYTFTICGIYTNSSVDTESSIFSQTDPANNIYLSYESLQAVIDASDSAANIATSDDGTETEAALRDEVNFTYVFANSENYENFSTAVYDLGLSEDYLVSSTDLAAFESSLTPLETLSEMSGWFFLIVLLIGGIILIVLNIFNLRERKYEVGVLTAIGMKKKKVASQFVCEVFSVTFVAIILGAIIGTCVSVPVTNTLLANQIENAQSSTEELNQNFGFSGKDQASFGGRGGDRMQGMQTNISYIDSVTSATDFTVILQLIGVGLILTIISSIGAMITIMRYEPLKILSGRS